ncbi:YeeE/YedE family protein [Terricaulis sp.]|uniref:YeeE/YedE family protein n=1 Tax=Terricaulis sp. TaxID=2768686 RepID=UPI0037830B73
MTDVFAPFLPALLGGALIGLAAGGLYALTGRIAGVSGVFGGAILLAPGAWRWAFVIGLLAAGAAAALLHLDEPTALHTASPLLLGASGLIAGIGARIGDGCTSGHGVCGLARFSSRSLVAVLVFMSSAIATVYVTQHLATPS